MKKKICIVTCSSCKYSSFSSLWGSEVRSFKHTGNPIDEKVVKIGFNFEETGAVASYGTSEQKGAQLAVDEINAAGGIDGKQIEVVDKDNKSETAEAASVSTNLVTQSKVAAIVGPATQVQLQRQ